MDYKFEELLKEHKIKSLDDPNLVDVWVTKAKDFLEKVEDMTPEEAVAADDELVADFQRLHPEELIDDPEFVEVKDQVKQNTERMNELEKKQRLDNLREQAKKDIKAVEKVEDLEKMKANYGELPDVLELIDKKIEELKKPPIPILDDKAKADKAKADKAKADKAKADKEKADKAKADKEKADKSKISRDKVITWLRDNHNKSVDYEMLKKMGIKPTGDNMVIDGIKLLRRYYFKVYTIDASGYTEPKK